QAARDLDLGPAEAAPDQAPTPDMAIELDRLLRANDLAALDLAGRVRGLAEAAPLCEAVERLEFTQARTLLARLAEDRGWEIPR
ncbi:MAG: hypothetical protein HQL39_14340, partial [Alphaproteobacteria bacterium]|nr:hypothetical protein [Alphaproteobacteria bacterium]